MENQTLLKPALIGLAKLQITLSQKGGPANDGNLFELIIDLQSRILKSFGLPETPENEKLLWFSAMPTDTEVENRIRQLHEAAVHHLTTNAKPDLQILREAQQENKDPFTFLPELNITTHIYMLFVYNEILLGRQDSAENVLHELRFAEKYELLNTIGKLVMGNHVNSEEALKEIKGSGLKYIDLFLINNLKR